jgi:hypothetical protein
MVDGAEQVCPSDHLTQSASTEGREVGPNLLGQQPEDADDPLR